MSELHPTGFTVIPVPFTAVFEAIENAAYSQLADIWEPGDPVYVKRRNQTPLSEDMNVITIYVGSKRKRAHFKPHLRRRLKAVKR